MINPMYCQQCRKPIEQQDIFCKHCGADQRVPSQRPAPSMQPPVPMQTPSPQILPAARPATPSGVHTQASRVRKGGHSVLAQVVIALFVVLGVLCFGGAAGFYGVMIAPKSSEFPRYGFEHDVFIGLIGGGAGMWFLAFVTIMISGALADSQRS
jgi:hypothetical protein